MNNQDFIIAYRDMKSIKCICDELEINYANLLSGRASEENQKKVADKLKVECYKIFSLVKLMEEK